MAKDYLSLAIRALVGSDDFAYTGEEYDSIEWIVEPTSKPTSKQVSDKIAALQKADADALASKEAQKAAILERLGLTAEEAKLLIS
jgi:hypothetical protein